jgi:hypothetical protein
MSILLGEMNYIVDEAICVIILYVSTLTFTFSELLVLNEEFETCRLLFQIS